MNNNNEWLLKDDEEQKAFIKNGRYFIENLRNDKSKFYVIKKEVNTRRNFALKCRITYLNGKETSGFGLNWGRTEKDSFRFWISANGHYGIDYMIDGEAITIKEWTENSVINKGRKPNIMEIIKNGEILHFKINNEVVFSSDFISFFGSSMGFIVSPNLKITVDFIQISN